MRDREREREVKRVREREERGKRREYFIEERYKKTKGKRGKKWR